MKKASAIRYSGSYFKHIRMANVFATILRPAIERGWDQCLVLEKPPEDESWLKELTELGVAIEYLPRPKSNFDWRCIKQTYYLCKKYNCDIFHCDNIHTSPMIGAWLANTPVRVWQKRSMSTAYEVGRAYTLKDRMALSVRTTCALATRVVAVSKTVKDELVHMGIPDRKIDVLINPFDQREFSKPRPRDVIRAEFGFSESDVVILTIGHAVPVKGWDMLLEAFKDLPINNVNLLLVGNTDSRTEAKYFDRLQNTIEAYKLKDRVVFTGHLHDVSEVLEAADLFVLPSRSEGFSNALLEGMGSGLPCIATNVGGAEDLIVNGENGLLVDRCDIAGLTNALRRLVVDTEYRSHIKERSVLPSRIKNRIEYADGFVNYYQQLR